ncbi:MULTISPECIES: septation protein IspZ [unclassified Novosphingobium]|uniref:septation protein IspZ n=1 Tax=unclassified Novosphingobium TaxID=2644732 RepID=UPI0025F37A5C|nr:MULTISPECIES: septation protein IspZ [unclassified Novosphingobium]HQV04610.1 septation protein IspZ [Novosphingobium sp.]
MTSRSSDAAAAETSATAPPDRREVRRLERSTLLSAVAPLVVDLGSTLAFYAILAITGDPRLAASVGMALAVGQLVFAKVRHRPIAPLQWASIAVVLIVGTLTLLTNDPRFVLVKATLVYGIIGSSMLKRGWMARYIPAIAAAHLPTSLLGWFEKAWAALLLGTGVLNFTLVLAVSAERTAQYMAIWVFASKLCLFAIQYVWCRSVARPAIKATMERNP